LEEEHRRLQDNTKKLGRHAATLSDETYQDVQVSSFYDVKYNKKIPLSAI
jgi:hypothetical protein